MVRIIICCESEEMSVNVFKQAILYVKSSRVNCEISYKTKPDDIIKKISEDKHYYDVYILDALSAECTGLAGRIRKSNFTASIIFLLDDINKVDRVIKYRVSALVKSANDNTGLVRALRFSLEEQSRINPYFIIKNKSETIKTHYNDIIFFESCQRIVTMHTRDKAVGFYAKLSDISAYIPSDVFIRCHRSYIVNVKFINCFDKVNHCLDLSGGVRVDVSKGFYSQFTEAYENYVNAKHNIP